MHSLTHSKHTHKNVTKTPHVPHAYLLRVDGEGSIVSEDDVLGVVHDGVLLHDLRRAVRLLDLALHVLRGVYNDSW